MRTSRILPVLCSGLLLAGLWGVSECAAQSTVGAVLSFDETLLDGGGMGVSRAVNGLGQPIYLPADNIALRLTLSNSGPDEVVATYGYGLLPFEIYLRFVGPDGQWITSGRRIGEMEPGPAPKILDEATNRYVQVTRVEILPGAPEPWRVVTKIPNAHDEYALTQAGRYAASAVVPFGQYPRVDYTNVSSDPPTYYSVIGSGLPGTTVESNRIAFSIVEDRDCDGYFFPDGCGSCPRPADCASTWVAYPESDCDDNNPAVHPGAPEVPDGVVNNCDPNGRDALGPKGNVVVRAELHTVGTGNHPGSTKEPLKFLRVKLMDRSPGSCAFQAGLSWRAYQAIWEGCPAVQQGTTDNTGTVVFAVDPGDYAAFAWYPAGSENLFMGGAVDPVAVNQTVGRYLQMIRKADGKNSPAKYTVRTGSELMVIEPEYVEWTGTQELYPFIFQSLGEWGVTTSIAPPEGFVADQPSLTAEVNNTLSAVQFVVTDVGSEWVDTAVEHTVRHKNKTEKIKSRIGVVKKKK